MVEADLSYLQVRIAQNSDQAAFKAVYEMFYTRLLYFSKVLGMSQVQSEEIIQDVFVKIWQQRSTLVDIENLRTYIYTATRNTALNYRRKNDRLDLVADYDDIPVSFHESVKTPEDYLLSAEMIRRLNNLLNTLPPKCRLIFKMVKEDGLKYREVAGILQLSVKTVENQLAIALKKIAATVSLEVYN